MKEAYKEKLAKKPEEGPNSTMPDLGCADTRNIELDPECVEKVIKQTKRCVTNCPITSNRYEIFKLMVGKNQLPDEQQFLTLLSAFLSVIAVNKVPEDIRPIFANSQGLCIPKRDGKQRPLGLRECFANLAAKCTLRHFREQTINTFEGINDALTGSNKMGELIALSSHHLKASPDHDTIFVDLPNAFNECSRSVAAKQIVDKCPSLAGIFELLYQRSSRIWLRNNEDDWEAVLAEEGCVQGCALGPYVFGFATLPTYERVANFLKGKPNCFFKAYSDDSIIGASHEYSIEAFDALVEGLGNCGLKVNFKPHKTVVMIGKCANEEDLARRIQSYRERGFGAENIKIHPSNGGNKALYGYVHLGVPVGSIEFCRSALSDLIQKFRDTCKCDSQVTSVQQRWNYLYWVIRQKFTYWYRQMCPSTIQEALPDIVAILKTKFEEIANFNISDDQWEQICLPIKSHGFGIGSPDLTHAAAFVANVEETLKATKVCLKDAPYLEFLDLSRPIGEDYVFESEDIKRYVLGYRRLKQRIIDASEGLGEIIDEQRVAQNTEKKKLQHYYFTS